MERRSFFSAEIDQGELSSKAKSLSDVDRWLAAVALGQVHELWAFDLLRKLKIDQDDNTRTAANNALRQFPRSFFEALNLEGDHSGEVFKSGVWKVRPLPTYESSNRDLFLAAIMDIVSTEGPVTGGRIQSRLLSATVINSGRRVSNGRLQTLLTELLKANKLTRADSHLDSDEVVLWIVHAPGTPEYVIRGRDGRDITEIPVNEARAVLLDSRLMRRNPSNRDAGFRVLMEHYGIKPNEFFLVGEAMEKQWQTLFLANES